MGIFKTEFFGLLTESSQVTNEKMRNAYAQFTVHMETVNNSEDYATAFRTLNIARVELGLLQSFYRHEKGEKCPEINVSAKGYIVS